jgi:hypothetical protein
VTEKVSKDDLRRLLAAKKSRLEELKRQRDLNRSEHKEALKKLRAYEEKNKIMYLGDPEKGYLGPFGLWVLNQLQKQLINALASGKFNIFLYTGANRIGKTFITFICIYSLMTGKFPWEPEERTGWLWELYGWKPPIKIRWIGGDWEKQIKTVLIPKIKELWPASHPLEVRKNNIGVEANWLETRNGSTIEIMSNKTESILMEGWHGHVVAFDEPPKQDVRDACARGLVDTCGIEIYAMTLLSEPWVVQKVQYKTLPDGKLDPKVFFIEGVMKDNVGFGITQRGVDDYASKLDPEMVKIRIFGKSAFSSSKLLHIRREVHYIPRFDIPSYWMVDIAIDIGIAKAHDILFLATSPTGRKYLIQEAEIPGDGTELGQEIIRIIENKNYRANRFICDPLAKGDKHGGATENTTWAKIDSILGMYGHLLELGSKDKADGILKINSLLSSKYGEPSLYVFDDLRKATMQLDSWITDKDGVPKKYRANELPGDDQCENTYRLVMLETIYSEPGSDIEYSTKRGDRDSDTGY